VAALPLPSPADVLLSQRQAGVLARWQVAGLDISRHAVAHRLATGRWQRWGSRVLITHSGPISPQALRWAAVLHGGRGAVLGGLTAAGIDGLRGYPGERIDVIVPSGTRVPVRTPLQVHYSELRSSEVQPMREPPRTRPARSLVDAAAWAADDDRACAILAAGVQQRRVAVGDLQAELARRSNVRRHRFLTLAVDDIAGGSHSLAEIDLVRLCRQAGLPPPERQAVRTDSAGRRRYLDAAWPAWLLVVEIDGAAHAEVRQWAADMWRQNEVGGLSGNRVLRFPAMGVRRQPRLAAAQIRCGLELGGWRPR
jgi:hypothetical protein